MKNFIKSSLIILLIIVYACSSGEDSVSDDSNPINTDPPIATTQTIVVEGINGLDIDELQAQSFKGISEIDNEGVILDDLQDEETDNVPMLVLKNDAIIFGYYSRTGEDDSVSINDILLFYYTLNPSFAWLNLTNGQLLNKIKESADYEELKSLVVDALDSNTNPLDSSVFQEKLIEESNKVFIDFVASSGKTSSGKTRVETEYNFTFSRNGNVQWNKEFPTFSKVGVGIKGPQGDLVAGPYILDKITRYPISVGSLLEWMIDLFQAKPSETTTVNLPQENGNYEVVFSNGVDGFGHPLLETLVDAANIWGITLEVLVATAPIGMKEILGDSWSCVEPKLVTDLAFNIGSVVGQSEAGAYDFIANLGSDALGFIKDCVSLDKFKYANSIKNALKIIDFTSKAEAAKNVAFWIIDYAGADIKGSETRYLYNDISYGKLTNTNVSGDYFTTQVAQTEFIGPFNSNHTYNGIVTEEIIKYNLENNLPPTGISRDPSNEPAGGIPMFINTLSGDASLNIPSNYISTTVESSINLVINMTMGTLDSKVEIKTTLEGKGLPESEIIDLKPEQSFNYEGTWLMTVNNLDGSLHHYERVVFDINGVSTYNETNIPDQNTGWYSTGYTYYINYNASSGLINITVGGTGLNFPFVVNSVLDTRFFGDGDYYSAGYNEYFKLILDRQ